MTVKRIKPEPPKLNAGWGWPLNSKKAHYYTEGEVTSICGAWMYSGPRENTAHDSPDNCAKCKKMRPKSMPW
jgi:hypothetical protein